MQLIRCTQKLFKELGQRPVENVEFINNHLSTWHANIFRIERRKCLLLSNDETLYTIFIPFIKKKELQNFTSVFSENLSRNLQSEGFSESQIQAVVNEHQNLIFAKSNNRSVLGSMNDQKIQVEARVEYNGGFDNTSILELNKEINRNPLKAINFVYPIDLLKEKLNEIS